jgi:A/G-specific adenine glycosylase
LPWRGERDPYRILVSEVMLQQTQASRVAPIYERFLDRFPDVASIAGADAADVLDAWTNLGYPRRALNLWRACRAIVELGTFPRNVEDLQALPGVGPYTARAVASFAFDVDVAAVDANVRRVVQRFHGTTDDVQEIADSLVPRGKAAAWNQAMIDLGAEVCRARDPACSSCPVSAGCSWHRGVRPAVKRRAASPRFEETTRYARGRVMAALRDARRIPLNQIAARSGLEAARARSAVAALETDDLLHRAGREVVLGPR